jgi:hypothetical protein
MFYKWIFLYLSEIFIYLGSPEISKHRSTEMSSSVGCTARWVFLKPGEQLTHLPFTPGDQQGAGVSI